ncbi:MAG: cation:proton antiporter [Bacillota bacterium]|uniref:Cation:proton antiporter n=1 Tax=Virgibacillus salarius TaxID=447199 RepID=A0A941DVS1_9BACI|nr:MULTISPECIES: cation:proton antiporter [Bacillaceae]NAZ07835.1 sodium:proton antiporter [Agaribacter marinus]MBR7795118.1 cation:proton antiporter [Virgibacillus salarius]MCC2252045.1 cation:proton antiporter [Virgibacillus sp. AGTR]QRZ16759.1 cation:proton antiporter [Virgibacillus sp. AGTR]WBX79751.1 cation:proton antiporter [Virgibacillus salarius]
MSVHHILLLLIIGYIVFSIDKKQEYFPVPTVLVLIGITLSPISYFANISITKDLIFHVFLPALLFISAYQFPTMAWKKYKYIIGGLGTIGLLLTIAIFGGFVYLIGNLFIQISIIAALLIAAILSPTDPVSVIAILKKSSSDRNTADIVEGESLLNDGTSIVVFGVLLSMLTQGTTFSLSGFVSEFLLVSLGGVAIGIAFGWLMSKAVHYTDHRQYQVMLSIIVAYGSFYLGELMDVSGVLSTVTAGMMLSYEFGKNIKEDHFRDQLDGFWGIIEPTILSIIFLLIGIQSARYLVFSEWQLAILLFLGSLIVRFLVITAMTQFHSTWKTYMSLRECAVIAWTGIKGTMSVALVLGFEAATDKSSEFISIIFVVILLSLVIQSASVYPLVKRLKGS